MNYFNYVYLVGTLKKALTFSALFEQMYNSKVFENSQNRKISFVKYNIL